MEEEKRKKVADMFARHRERPTSRVAADVAMISSSFRRHYARSLPNGVSPGLSGNENLALKPSPVVHCIESYALHKEQTNSFFSAGFEKCAGFAPTKRRRSDRAKPRSSEMFSTFWERIPAEQITFISTNIASARGDAVQLCGP